MKILAEMRDKKGESIKIISYKLSWLERLKWFFTGKNQVTELFREGYPNSFDEHDLRAIKKILKQKPEETSLLAICGKKLVGCLTGYSKKNGHCDLYINGYRYTKRTFRERGIARILQGVAEEILKEKARLILVINTGILSYDDLSYQWFKAVGFEEYGEIPKWFRDDLSGVFLGKRNPYYPLGKGIPGNSVWCPESADSRTGKRISKEEYQEVINNPGLVPKEKWGLDLIGRENIIEYLP